MSAQHNHFRQMGYPLVYRTSFSWRKAFLGSLDPGTPCTCPIGVLPFWSCTPCKLPLLSSGKSYTADNPQHSSSTVFLPDLQDDARTSFCCFCPNKDLAHWYPSLVNYYFTTLQNSGSTPSWLYHPVLVTDPQEECAWAGESAQKGNKANKRAAGPQSWGNLKRIFAKKKKKI